MHIVHQINETIRYLSLCVIKIFLLKWYALGKAHTMFLVISILYCCFGISYQEICSCIENHSLQLSSIHKELLGFSSSEFGGFSQGTSCVLWIEWFVCLNCLWDLAALNLIIKSFKVQEYLTIAQTLTWYQRKCARS